MDKKSLSERDICTKYITPALVQAGWDIQNQIREEVSFTEGRIIVRGKSWVRGAKKRADYILFYKPNIPLAIIEAKDNNHSIGAGMQQALEYGKMLKVPFIFSSNGDGFLFHDNTISEGNIEKEIHLEDFPSPKLLWDKYKGINEIKTPEEEQIISQNYYYDERGITPRYYQQIAINRTIEAIAKGQDRILLVMATGTGKTYTAFQIVWRLWRAGIKKRILYLADRNILIDQTRTGDFKPFRDKMTTIKHRKIDKSYEIYFALYQGLTGSEDIKNVYKEFSKDFFDLIIVDECHRGSADEASAWRDVLTYFKNATHIGMTATPKETKDVSNIAYFGKPIYTYSLKQGIDDGFLAPYKVVRISINVDVEGYRPEKGKKDKYGYELEDRVYNTKDFDRSLAIDERTQIVAKKITEFLRNTDPLSKTIVFCVDTDHAERMRQALVNENAGLVSEHSNYVVRITGDDEYGKLQVDDFIDVEELYPVIATTSKLLSTGVDTKMVKLIALDSNIGSMTEFKQIIGRGTRVREEDGKVFFTIMDFRKVTNLFADPDFDGEPELIYIPGPSDPPVPPEPPGPSIGEYPPESPDPPPGTIQPRKYYVNGVEVEILNERVQYYGKDGKLITESLIDYARRNILDGYSSLDVFLRRWNEAEKKEEVINELLEHGILLDELKEEVGADMDSFDLVSHVAFEMPPLSRKERVNKVKKRNYFVKYGDAAQKVILALLDKYENEGILAIENTNVFKIQPFNELGTPIQIMKMFGDKSKFLNAIKELEQEIYKSA